MNIKEAIEFVKNKWVTYLDKQEIKNKNEVIELLQRGEKYEKMWKKLKINTSQYDRGTNILDMVYEYEQKYFPKGGSQ